MERNCYKSIKKSCDENKENVKYYLRKIHLVIRRWKTKKNKEKIPKLRAMISNIVRKNIRKIVSSDNDKNI